MALALGKGRVLEPEKDSAFARMCVHQVTRRVTRKDCELFQVIPHASQIAPIKDTPRSEALIIGDLRQHDLMDVRRYAPTQAFRKPRRCDAGTDYA